MGDVVSGSHVLGCHPLKNCDNHAGRCKRRFLHEEGETILQPDGLDGVEGPDDDAEEPIAPLKLERRQQLTLDLPSQQHQSVGTDSWPPLDVVCRPMVRSDDPGYEDAEMLGTSVSSHHTVSLPRGPQRHAVPTYATSERTELAGEIRSGELVQFRLGEKLQKVTLTIYVNGFTVVPSPGPGSKPEKTTRPWSPFTLVETCQIQVKRQADPWAVFKLTILRKKNSDLFFYFGCSGKDAESERKGWVEDVSEAISRVSLSLIPAHSITVRPVPGQPGTVSRLMAGYLMLLVDMEVVSLYYCELQAYSGGSAKLAMYQDEWCEHEVGSLPIVNTSVVSTRKGEYCAVLGLDSSLLCARTWKEKELWLRAISNVKVKLMYEAPDPTTQELSIYRKSVLDRVVEDEPKDDGLDSTRTDVPTSVDLPLLASVRASPRPSPRGDVWHPEPEPTDTPLQTPRGGEVVSEHTSEIDFPAVGVKLPDVELSVSGLSRLKQRYAFSLDHPSSQSQEVPASMNPSLKSQSDENSSFEAMLDVPNGHSHMDDQLRNKATKRLNAEMHDSVGQNLPEHLARENETASGATLQSGTGFVLEPEAADMIAAKDI